MMKNWIYLAALGFTLSGQSAFAADINYNIVSLNETVSQNIERDMMEVRLMIQEEDTDPARLANTVTQKTNQVLAKIKKNGDFNATLTDRNSYQTNRQNPSNNKKTDYFWQEQVTISIKSKNFAELNKLVASVQNVARLQGVTFSVSKEKLKSVEEGLTKEAIEQFRKRATMISKALGGSGYKIVDMNVGSTGGAMPVSYRNNSVMLKGAVAASADMAIPESASGEHELTFGVSGSIQVLGL